MRRQLAALITMTLFCAGTALAAGPNLPELSDKQIAQYKDLNGKATDALQDGSPKKAANLYERAARIHDGNEGLFYNLACAYAKDNQTANTLAALDRALAAGWADASWPKQDTDLASVHDTLGFERWIERVAESEGGSAWPTVDAEGLGSNADEIEETSDDWTAEILRLRGVLGRTESTQANRVIAAWQAASWDRVAARSADTDERAEASREAMAAIAGTDATRLSALASGEVIRRAESWLDEFSELETAGSVRLTLAEAAQAQRMRSDDEAVREGSKEIFERDLLVLAATTTEGPGLEGALVRLIGYSSDNMDRATRLYDRLIDAAADADEARTKMRSGYSTRGIAYKVEGLPEFEATSTDGDTFGRTNLPGRVTLLDFWATWCGPCIKELPNLKAAYQQYHDAGFDIVGISLDKEASKDQQAFLAWCEENDMPWPQVYDGKGWSSRLAGEFGVRAIPFALLVDDDGNVLAADDDLRGEKLAEVVAQALTPGAAAIGGQ